MKNDFGNKKKKEISVQALILLLAGVMSILLVIQSIPAASFSAAIVFPSTVLVCGSFALEGAYNDDAEDDSSILF